MATDGSNGTTLHPSSTEQVKTDIVTLTRFLTEEQAKHKEATGDFTYGLSHILQSCGTSPTKLTNVASSSMPFNFPSSQSHTGFDVPALQTSLA